MTTHNPGDSDRHLHGVKVIVKSPYRNTFPLGSVSKTCWMFSSLNKNILYLSRTLFIFQTQPTSIQAVKHRHTGSSCQIRSWSWDDMSGLTNSLSYGWTNRCTTFEYQNCCVHTGAIKITQVLSSLIFLRTLGIRGILGIAEKMQSRFLSQLIRNAPESEPKLFALEQNVKHLLVNW